jgi:hypothetical protein
LGNDPRDILNTARFFITYPSTETDKLSFRISNFSAAGQLLIPDLNTLNRRFETQYTVYRQKLIALPERYQRVDFCTHFGG